MREIRHFTERSFVVAGEDSGTESELPTLYQSSLRVPAGRLVQRRADSGAHRGRHEDPPQEGS
ncbi:MAG: hypothetical protein M3143_06965 [Actinomycetota bacterium]|nr:hypothetical protein [Actinomycetota bacterium]